MENKLSVAQATASGRQLRRQLRADETVLWTGQPRKGLLLSPSDKYGIPCSILFAVFAVAFALLPPPSADGLTLLFDVLILMAAAYVCIGHFFYDAHARRHTCYAVTDRRVVIVLHTFLSRRVKSIPIRKISRLTFVDNRNGTGDIYLGHVGRWMRTFYPPTGPMSGIYLPPHLHCVEQPRVVHELIEELIHRNS